MGVWGCSVRRPSRPFTRWDRVPTRAAWACRRPAADDFPWTCAAGGARRPGGRLERRGARNPRHSVAVPVGGGGGVARLRALSEPASSSGSLNSPTIRRAPGWVPASGGLRVGFDRCGCRFGIPGMAPGNHGSESHRPGRRPRWCCTNRLYSVPDSESRPSQSPAVSSTSSSSLTSVLGLYWCGHRGLHGCPFVTDFRVSPPRRTSGRSARSYVYRLTLEKKPEPSIVNDVTLHRGCKHLHSSAPRRARALTAFDRLADHGKQLLR